MMLELMRFILFFLSLAGYILFFTKKVGVRLEFAPMLFCAGISMLMFVSGILNLMLAAVLLSFALGIVLLVYYIKKLGLKGLFNRRELLLLGGFIVVGIYFAILLNGILVNEYDNFSHYAIVLKDMLRSDSMPSFKSINIMFEAYPLGSSLFLYYCCKILGTAEHCALWANLFISLSAFFTLCAFVRKGNGSFLVAAAAMLYALIWRADFNSLLVDTLLPATAVAALAILFYYRDDLKKASLCMALMLSFVANIKNSGIFFVLMVLAALWYFCRKKKLKEQVRLMAYPILAVAATMLIWKRHTDMMYLNAANSRHAMSLSMFSWMFSEKPADSFLQIARELIKSAISPENGIIQVLLPLSIALLILAVALKGGRRKALLALLALWAVMISYHLGLYAMYIFSMPLDGALAMAGYGRYVGSALVFVIGMAAVMEMDITSQLTADKKQRLSVCVALLLFMLPVFFLRHKIPTLYNKNYHQQLYEETDRYLLRQAIERYSLPEGANYIIYTENWTDYLGHVARYDLWVSKAVTTNTLEMENMQELFESNDYLIVLHNTADIRQQISQYGYTCPDDDLPAAIKLN